LRSEETGEQASPTKLEKLFIPEIVKKTEILTGSPSEASEKLLAILKEKGVLS
jgi:electron transfer flavoprotein alpha/beta subunit